MCLYEKNIYNTTLILNSKNILIYSARLLVDWAGGSKAPFSPSECHDHMQYLSFKGTFMYLFKLEYNEMRFKAVAPEPPLNTFIR